MSEKSTAQLLFATSFVGVSRLARARRLLAAVIDSVGDGVLRWLGAVAGVVLVVVGVVLMIEGVRLV